MSFCSCPLYIYNNISNWVIEQRYESSLVGTHTRIALSNKSSSYANLTNLTPK
jgi:hypothetical protein